MYTSPSKVYVKLAQAKKKDPISELRTHLTSTRAYDMLVMSSLVIVRQISTRCSIYTLYIQGIFPSLHTRPSFSQYANPQNSTQCKQVFQNNHKHSHRFHPSHRHNLLPPPPRLARSPLSSIQRRPFRLLRPPKRPFDPDTRLLIVIAAPQFERGAKVSASFTNLGCGCDEEVVVCSVKVAFGVAPEGGTESGEEVLAFAEARNFPCALFGWRGKGKRNPGGDVCKGRCGGL